jgi:hypothetical protein
LLAAQLIPQFNERQNEIQPARAIARNQRPFLKAKTKGEGNP